MPIEYPNTKAHSIQVTRTVQALSARREVHLVVRRSGSRTPWRERARAAYGIHSAPGFRLIELPAALLREPLLPLALAAVGRRVPGRKIFYARRYPIASALLRTRWLHGQPVVFETHKKEGFRKEDHVEDSPFGELREAIEAGNHSFRLLRRVYTSADGLVFLHEHSRKAAQQRLPIARAISSWHGLDAGRMQLGGCRPRDLVFCGSLGPHKLFELIPEALRHVKNPTRVDVFGGTPDEVRAWAHRASDLGISQQLRFLGRVPHAELRRRLREYRFGLLTMEGLKVVDYLENGVIPVLPRIPSFTELFDESDVAFFRPDDAASLAQTLDRRLPHATDDAGLRRIAERHPIDARIRELDALFDELAPPTSERPA